jgi:cyclophilin family peptidyl-prolyl cis-trans isomerase
MAEDLRMRWLGNDRRELLQCTIGLLCGILLAGCMDGAVEPAKSEEGTSAASEKPATAPVPKDALLHQSFAAATRSEPPADWQRPPDLTVAGKSVGKLYTDLLRVWDSIKFQDDEGKSIPYRAVLETDLGVIEISLRSDLAPNHVRNFIALTRIGYYDGLVFERTVRARSAEQPEVEVDVLEGGCPLGTGEVGVGSLGYWLKPELSKEPHEPGTVGACHGADLDSASCKFYIALNKAPFLDGNFTVFGKVTRGLDVAQRIFSLPVSNDPEYPEGDRPEKPVVIRKVTIVTPE